MENLVSEPQMELFGNQSTTRDTTMTFVDNMKLPIHRWFRYSAGFSGEWVRSLLREHPDALNIIDPFAGSGTVMLESGFLGRNSYGVEPHPFVNRIANVKTAWNLDVTLLKQYANDVLQMAEGSDHEEKEIPELILKCYGAEACTRLYSLRQAFLNSSIEEPYDEMIWFLITSILRKTSAVGTAQWQYVLPNKSKSRVIDPYIAYQAKLSEIVSDIRAMKAKHPNRSVGRVLKEDSRGTTSIPDDWGDLVITSPPYANNYDYADATRLEMTFWGDVLKYSDLHDKVRKYLMVSCTQHASKNDVKQNYETILQSDLLTSISEELKVVFETLSEVRKTKGGKKQYHLMILAYFRDISLILKELRRATKPTAKMCFVVGDSAPYGVYVPVDKWIGKLAIQHGFTGYSFEKLRDRNTKWKNRKHRVLLKEGRLWIH
ncbi:MAG: DNA modification methylase [Cyanobacteria bacterium J06649_11]